MSLKDLHLFIYNYYEKKDEFSKFIIIALFLLSIYFLNNTLNFHLPYFIKQNRLFEFFFNSSFKLNDEIIKRGGFISGLVNDGNTCFRNSVLQSLSSSKILLEFLNDEIDKSTIEDITTSKDLDMNDLSTNNNKKNKKNRKKNKKNKMKNGESSSSLNINDSQKTSPLERKSISFLINLKELIDKLNYNYYNKKYYFRANNLIRSMIDEKNQDVVLGYAQQDAQEFFQAILAKLEKNVKQIEHIPLKEKNKSNQNNILKSIPFEKLPSDALLGHDHLDKVGTVFIPTDQINPNLIKNNESINSSNTNQLFTPFKLITPLDGIIAERIGCLNCGENGGIRYSVSSSLSLNLPNYTNDSISLYELLSNYTQPEIIEQVNCNRCTLASMYDSINSKLKELTSEDVNINQIDNNTQEDENSTIEKTSMAINDSNNKLKSVLTERLNTISNVLSKPVIDDDSFKTLSTSNMTCQTSKSKQLLISRPPPLLSIHINRSVFDPTTYQIRKNNSRVLFESRLNLNGFCCNIDEINLDARLPMNKRDVTPDEKINESSELLPTPSNSQTPSADFLDSKNEKISNSDSNELSDDDDDDEVITPLTYNLRSVIVHYGSHNYGHYVCYRKLRGVWWRISDETVYVVDESEVLSTPGVFMLFYEYDYDPKTGKLFGDIEYNQDLEIEFD